MLAQRKFAAQRQIQLRHAEAGDGIAAQSALHAARAPAGMRRIEPSPARRRCVVDPYRLAVDQVQDGKRWSN